MGVGSQLQLCWCLWSNLAPAWRRQCGGSRELSRVIQTGRRGDGGVKGMRDIQTLSGLFRAEQTGCNPRPPCRTLPPSLPPSLPSPPGAPGARPVGGSLLQALQCRHGGPRLERAGLCLLPGSAGAVGVPPLEVTICEAGLCYNCPLRALVVLLGSELARPQGLQCPSHFASSCQAH